MKTDEKLKAKAVQLRREGKTYREILAVVPVAKSTLSLWLRSVSLAKPQQQRLSDKKYAAQKRGAEVRREARIDEELCLKKTGIVDVGKISEREKFLLGVALYWAEGTKRSGHRIGMMVDFANSDPAMIKQFLRWLFSHCGVGRDEITLRLHLHEAHKSREKDIQKLWLSLIKEPSLEFGTTLFKKHNPKTVRKKIGNDYIGLVSIRVKKSTTLQRRIMGWIYAIIATQKWPKSLCKYIAGSSNGRTTVFGAVYRGSSPCPAANLS